MFNSKPCCYLVSAQEEDPIEDDAATDDSKVSITCNYKISFLKERFNIIIKDCF